MTTAVLTTPAVLDRMARDLPDHPALITEERTLTFAQLRQEVRRAAAAMITLGVQAGDRVAIWSPNTWHWVVAALGIHHAGAVLVPVNVHYTAEEAADILARSGARLLFAMDGSAELDRAALPELRQIVQIPAGGDSTWDRFLAGPSAPRAEVDDRAATVRPEDVADILFTSGTTGRSKGVLCAHRQSLSGAAAAAQCREMSAADRYLCMAPFFHNYGYKDGILGCLQSGATLVTQRTFDPAQVLKMIAGRRITVLPGPPTFFQVLLDHPSRKAHDLSSLRMAATGGATVPVALVERILDDLGVETVLTGYGLTEAGGFGTACRRGDDPVTVATTCGRPIAGFELRIECPDEAGAGEVLLRGPNVMLGYLDDPAATAAVIDADGWLHTGDIGTVDAAGNLSITDRLTDMYICAGINVYPAEVEQVLSRLDAVSAVAVIGVPDARFGEVGRAFVVVRPDLRLDEQTVIGYARAHLANFKAPRSVVFLEELPRNAGGKILKTALRQITYTTPEPITPQGLGGPPIGKVENWVADAWQALLNISRPGRRDTFTELGGDSLAAVEFSRMLQTQFGVSMSLDSLAQRPTVAAVVAGLEPGAEEMRQPVVQLRKDGEGPVILMIPGLGGHAWRFTSLADSLAGPCDVAAVSLMDLRDGPGGIRDRIRSTALAALRPEVVEGRPIVVAGYSFGAMIATEVVCRLLENDIPVTKLVLLDPDPLDSGIDSWNPVDSDRLIFLPGSPAARQLEENIAEVSGLLQDAYLDGSIRLPNVPVAWIQSASMAEKFRSETMIFRTPVSQIDRTVLHIGHIGMMRIPEVYQLADWLDRQLPGRSQGPSD